MGYQANNGPAPDGLRFVNRWSGPRWLVAFLLIGLCCLNPLEAEDTKETASPAESQLRAVLQPLVDSHRGDVAIAIVHLTTGDAFYHRADTPMPTASLIKLPLMVALYDAVGTGAIDLQTTVRLRAEDKVPGSGELTSHFSDGIDLPIRDYVRLMMRHSDNTATNVVIDQLGLPAINERFASWGLEDTRLHSKVYRGATSVDPAMSREFGLGRTTAREMVDLLHRLHDGHLNKDELNAEMIDHLKACDDATKLARHLAADTVIAHKTGAIGNCRTDAGILTTASGPVAVCVLTNRNEDQSWGESNEAEILCGKIGRVIYDQFGAAEDDGSLRQGSTGRLVESLQRTLNERLTPSPSLSIDGDFGPATRAAVVRFQTENGITADGAVGPATWKVLGTLVAPPPLADDDPAAVEVPRRPQPADDAPPLVTAKAWVIANADSGEIVAGSESRKPLHPASTTKIMTALVVLDQARKDPDLLSQMVTMSERADATVGSSCRLRQGESVPMRDLLYGLLLPSGNDAAVAIAQHVGERLGREQGQPEQDGYDRFIAEMNATAERLHLASAHFENPNGLTEATHRISAADLAILGHHAMQHALFRQIVATRHHNCTVQGESGYQRTIAWSNTNQLLDIEGFEGIKTGTTEAAGSCLVACGARGNQRWIVVVLGAASGARYVDAQNLFYWISRQPPQTVGEASDSDASDGR
jgi:D-alanyl-D-alanine carboxypeptidase (penicillin-binding protein 5/6)